MTNIPNNKAKQPASTRDIAPVNLCQHHAQCEMNYHLSVALTPGLHAGQAQWVFELDTDGLKTAPAEVHIRLFEAAPYTSTLDVLQVCEGIPHMHTPRVRVRLYHDVEMAEVVAWDNHRHWLPVYTYPNRRMYLPDEKLAINRFLGEWLSHCLKLGIACGEVCESIRRNKI